jgi:sterol desaturase/sphingolipid hydroxylase (fatty acid hydroxylase superfamily)
MELTQMTRNLLQIFAVTIGFMACAVATALVLAVPAVEQALGLSAWPQDGYEGGLAYLLFVACSGLVVDLLRYAAEPRQRHTLTR